MGKYSRSHLPLSFGGGVVRSQRQGAALFLVLLTCVALTAAITVLMRLTVAQAQLRELTHNEMQAEILRADAELIARSWLVTYGANLTTPLQEPYRPTRLLDTRLTVDGQQIRVSVDAWDACSGIPCAAGKAGRDLMLLAPDIAYEGTSSREAWWFNARSERRQRFPAPQDEDPTVNDDTAPLQWTFANAPVAVVSSPLGGDRVNWRTSAWPIVEALLVAARRPELSAGLQQARSTGAQFAAGLGWTQSTPPYLESSTDRWALLTCVRQGNTEHRWWSIVVAEGTTTTRVLVCYALP